MTVSSTWTSFLTVSGVENRVFDQKSIFLHFFTPKVFQNDCFGKNIVFVPSLVISDNPHVIFAVQGGQKIGFLAKNRISKIISDTIDVFWPKKSFWNYFWVKNLREIDFWSKNRFSTPKMVKNEVQVSKTAIFLMEKVYFGQKKSFYVESRV